jgi:hypothetical protein
MFYGEAPGYEIVPFAQFTSAYFQDMLAMHAQAEAQNYQGDKLDDLSGHMKRITNVEEVDSWLSDHSVMDLHPDETSADAYNEWSLLRMIVVLMTREYNFVTYYSELYKDDGRHGLQYQALLWERK